MTITCYDALCMADFLGEEYGISREELTSFEPTLQIAIDQLHAWRKTKEAIFFDLPNMVSGEMFRDHAIHVANHFENLVVLGIGGSALGLRSLASALLPPFHNLLDKKDRCGKPRLFICDNIDPDTFSALLHLLDIKKTCFNVISKSGQTIETTAQFFFILEYVKKHVGKNWKNHIIVTTDAERGELRAFAEKEHVLSFVIPSLLGGRFSVLSSVGLFPAACVGINIAELLAGAASVTSQNLTLSHPACKVAAVHYLLATKKEKTISVMMPYADALRDFSEWYAQLWAESLGKGGKGMTPVKALGATDQHSQLQLYMDGPNDKVITFLRIETFSRASQEICIQKAAEPFLEGKSFDQILNAEQAATAEALANVKRPSLTMTLSQLNETSLGALFMTYEIATTLMGALMQINPFDQPGVELSKKLTREILMK